MSFDLSSAFHQLFNRSYERLFFCPGRVNLIGEHIDYNGGNVMPCAISKGTWLAVARNTDKVLRFRCINFPETADLKLQNSYSKTGKEWFNYPLGVINELFYAGHSLGGLDMIFYGNLPIGAGLSSSASVEVVMAFACNEFFGLNIPLVELALMSKKVENEFIGVNSGIMDQFAVAMGKEGSAILLDCDTLEHEYLPFAPKPYQMMIINSRKERKLSESKYNERFAECGQALKLLRQGADKNHLCDYTVSEFEKFRYLLKNEILEKRALHVVTEQERVMKAAEALRNYDWVHFGELMYESHESLRKNYEVSGRELDTIVDFCSGFDGCIGARMTGAGFGGCAVALVMEEKEDEFISGITAAYRSVVGYEPEVFSSLASMGVTTE